MPRHALATVTVLGLALIALPTAAYDSLAMQLGRTRSSSRLFASAPAHSQARVRDGVLLGSGTEQITRSPGGVLRIVQTRRYTDVLRDRSGRRLPLPEPWSVRTTLELSPELRLLRLQTALDARRSILRVVGDDAEDELERFFEWDRLEVRANPAGTRLSRSAFRAGERVEHDSYDYPRDAIPIEVVGTVLSASVANRIDRFDFDLLLPGGACHGVRARVRRVRDVTNEVRGYRLDTGPLRGAGELAVIDMVLASPIKRLFFPHHFYFVYSSAEPTKLLALWGGDPDDHLAAIREP